MALPDGLFPVSGHQPFPPPVSAHAAAVPSQVVELRPFHLLLPLWGWDGGRPVLADGATRTALLL